MKKQPLTVKVSGSDLSMLELIW